MKIIEKNLKLGSKPSDTEWTLVNIYPEYKRSDIIGIGGAFTEASAYNYSLLTEAEKEKLIKMYFSKQSGAGYTLGRIPIGSCDFGIDQYCMSEKEDLSDFNIDRDKKYIIPMIKDALAEAGELFLFASPWSPPTFMKTNGERIHGGKLKPEFYQTYADYFVKFLLAYQAEGIKIHAVSIQNEAKALQTWESCEYSAEEEGIFAAQYLRPTLNKNGLSDVKIIIWDHNKERLYDRTVGSLSVEGAKDAVWGAGFHWYSGHHFDALDMVRATYPDLVLLETELCHGDSKDKSDEERAVDYAVEYINALHHGASGICDWNLLLDTKEGGPYHCRLDGCYSPLYLHNESASVVEDSVYKVVRTISHHLDAGDRVIATTSYRDTLYTLAVNGKKGVRLFLYNPSDIELPTNIRFEDQVGDTVIPANALCVYTIEKM